MEHANGNAPTAIGMYFDGDHAPPFSAPLLGGQLHRSTPDLQPLSPSAGSRGRGRRGGPGAAAAAAVGGGGGGASADDDRDDDEDNDDDDDEDSSSATLVDELHGAPRAARYMRRLRDMVSQAVASAAVELPVGVDGQTAAASPSAASGGGSSSRPGSSGSSGGSSNTRQVKVIESGPLVGLDAADCYRCVGYFLGKAILERQTIPAYLADYILGHIVGSPVGLNELQQVSGWCVWVADELAGSLAVAGVWCMS